MRDVDEPLQLYDVALQGGQARGGGGRRPGGGREGGELALRVRGGRQGGGQSSALNETRRSLLSRLSVRHDTNRTRISFQNASNVDRSALAVTTSAADSLITGRKCTRRSTRPAYWLAAALLMLVTALPLLMLVCVCVGCRPGPSCSGRRWVVAVHFPWAAERRGGGGGGGRE
jgi:hypothetical protein